MSDDSLKLHAEPEDEPKPGLNLAGAYEVAIEIHRRDDLTLLAIGRFKKPDQITAATPWRVSFATPDGQNHVADSVDDLPVPPPRVHRPEKSTDKAKPRRPAAKKTTRKPAATKPPAQTLFDMDA